MDDMASTVKNENENKKNKRSDNLATIPCKASPFYNKPTQSYKVLSQDEIVQNVVEFVEDVNGIVQLNPTITRILLNHCKWDKAIMTERLFENPEKLYRDAHVSSPDSVNARVPSDNKECGICYAEMTPSSSTEVTCGHKFCTPCCSAYLTEKILREGSISIACAANDCNAIIDDDIVFQLVDRNEEAKLQYQLLITNSFVKQNELMRWCPAPYGCSFAIKVNHAPAKPICCYCKCGYEFCFDCTEEYHAPVPCHRLKQFRTYQEDGQLHDYSGPIKDCPNPSCDIRITKSSGSDVMEPLENIQEVTPNVPMISTQSVTNSPNNDESWLSNKAGSAEGPSRSIGSNNPGSRLHEPAGMNVAPSYMKYISVDRKFAEVRQSAESTSSSRQCPAKSRDDMAVFEPASLELVRTCRTLKYFAIFDMYANDVTQSELLKVLASDLELAAVRLGKSIDFNGNKDEYTDVTISESVTPVWIECQLRRLALLDYVDDGFNNDWWTFRDNPKLE
ncbi:E3 ubiquitin-protein ligase ARIH1-like isoform X2 [Bradysia coprophila]|uniref:E3 ubiquitin-protein ligase ARIH1-like isoform X2 n=1 Tax=Bradysia coprophila TaxID=38358 RepID=UPI00187DC5D9|nr:E3 ubiquitin-protein ligase ARIH1-like isoform X2 [Bradysia coprophila]